MTPGTGGGDAVDQFGPTASLLEEAVAAAFIAAAPDAFVAVDTDLRTIAWNRAAEALFGWSAAEVLGRVPPQLDAVQVEALRDRLATQEDTVPAGAQEDAAPTGAQGALERRRHRDGRPLAIIIERETPLRGPDGVLLGWGRFARVAAPAEIAVALRERLSGDLEQAGLDLGAVLDAVCRRAASVVEADRVGVYLASDGGGLEPACLHGADGVLATPTALPEDLAAGEVRMALEAEDLRVLGGPWAPEAGVSGVVLVPLRVGDRRLGVLLAARTGGAASHAARGVDAPARLALATIAQQAGIAIANAGLYARERTAVRRLEALDARKADHLAGLSHDLRSPLAGMLAFVQTMRRVEATATTEERLEYLDIMERQVTRLIGLVEDMLFGARLDAGRLAPDAREPHDLDEVVGALLATLPPAHRSRLDLDLGGPARAMVDRRQVERVVQNLVDNALVHTPAAARVAVSTRQEGPEVVLCVRDNGPGIPPDAMETLFTRYGRVGARRSGSTGLGLYTARGIVEAHGGTIAARSTEGEGTAFTVRLPATSA